MSEGLAVEPVVNAETQVEAEKVAAPSEAEKTDAKSGDKPPVNENKTELTEVDKIKYAMQKRIDRLVASRSETERKYQELLDAQKRLEGEKVVGKAPQEADFKTAEEYLKALGKYEAEQEFTKQQKAQSEKQRQEAYLKTIEARRAEFDLKEAEMRKSTPDYDEAVSVVNEHIAAVDKNSVGFSVFRDVMMGSKDMAAMSYYLGKNPDVLESLASKDPIDIARTLFYIEKDLMDKAPKQQQQQQPLPPKAVSGSPKASNKSLHEMDYKELKKTWKL